MSNSMMRAMAGRMQAAADAQSARLSASLAATAPHPFATNYNDSNVELNLHVNVAGGMNDGVDIKRISRMLGQEVEQEMRRRGIVRI